MEQVKESYSNESHTWSLKHTATKCRQQWMSQYRANLGWLPMSEFVQYQTILTMFGQNYLGEGILLQPPIDFGHKHSYGTRCSPWFADIFRFKKNFSQHLFWHQATVWWNSLPPNLFDDITNFNDGLLKYLHDLS